MAKEEEIIPTAGLRLTVRDNLPTFTGGSIRMTRLGVIRYIHVTQSEETKLI